MLDAGVPLVFSSDAPVVWPDWRQGVAAAVLRTSAADGNVYGPGERITVEEAIGGLHDRRRVAGLRRDREGDDRGLARLADLCVLGGDPFTGDPAEIPEMPILATVLDGTPVHVA